MLFPVEFSSAMVNMTTKMSIFCIKIVTLSFLLNPQKPGNSQPVLGYRIEKKKKKKKGTTNTSI